MLFLSTLSLRRATQGTRRRRFLYGISIHALLAESDFTSLQVSGKTPISIHALLAESDARNAPTPVPLRYFYPRSPCGERLHQPASFRQDPDFYPRSPCGERRCKGCGYVRVLQFLSTLSLRRATAEAHIARAVLAGISIHALLAESDAFENEKIHVDDISIHALLAESDPAPRRRSRAAGISIHALLAESDYIKTQPQVEDGISIHALLAESDSLPGDVDRAEFISIHALLAESDVAAFVAAVIKQDISIHALLAESDARQTRLCTTQHAPFLSTLSLRRATFHILASVAVALSFLSTLSLRRATAGQVVEHRDPAHFYPRSPCGERRKGGLYTDGQFLFLSTLSLRRATRVAHLPGRRA